MRKLIAVAVLCLLVVSQVLAICTYSIISQGYTTNANLCPTGDGKYYVAVADTIKWTDQSANSLVEASYTQFRCGTDDAVITRTSGTYVESSGEPWIDYSYYKIELAYRTVNVPNAKFVVDEKLSLSCARTHPSPIVINFAKSAFQFTSPQAGVYFDLSSSGTKQQIGWTEADSDVAFLVRGTNVLNGAQLFGNLNPQAPALFPDESANGYRALRLFDVNGDRQIGAADTLFGELRLWFDRNHNGISEAGEIETLAARGVRGISLEYVEIGKRDQYGNLHRQRAKVELVDGSTRWSTDVYPAQAREESITIETVRPRR
jgi:hypothetical protein